MDSKEQRESLFAELIRLESRLRNTDDDKVRSAIREEMSKQTEVIREKRGPARAVSSAFIPITGEKCDITNHPFFSDELLPFPGKPSLSLMPEDDSPEDLDMIGTVKAVRCKTYRWVTPEEGGDHFAVWPLSRDGIFPQYSKTAEESEWEGESGCRFWQYLDCKECLDHSNIAHVMEFALPPCPRDSYYRWGTSCHFYAPTRWFTNTDTAVVKAEWAYHESPDGSGFPSDYGIGYTYINFLHMVYPTLHELSGLKTDIRYVEGMMKVYANTSPRIHLGVSISLSCESGSTISTAHLDGAGDLFRFGFNSEDGIRYQILPYQ